MPTPLPIGAPVREGEIKVVEGERVNVVMECELSKAIRVLTAKGRTMNFSLSEAPNALDVGAYFGSVPGLSVRSSFTAGSRVS